MNSATIKHIKEELRRLLSVVDGWNEGAVPAVERDIVLAKFRTLYETLLFVEDTENPVVTSDIAEADIPLSEEVISISLDEVLADVFDDEMSSDGLSESAAEFTDEPEHDNVPTPEYARSEEPLQSGEPEFMPEQEQSPVPAPESDSSGSKQRMMSEERTKKTDCEKAASLFDVDGMVVRRSEKRRILMSLYETGGTTAVHEEEPAVRSEIPQAKSATDNDMSAPAEMSAEEGIADDVEVISLVEVEIEKEQTLSEVNSKEETPHVLGETINGEVQVLGDTIVRPKDAVSEMLRSTVSNLRGMIGINDRFLLIRDLFGGDASAYDNTIAHLDSFSDLDDCMIYIAENFEWNPNSDGAKLITELLERKLG